jgi:hypothetical protein
MALCGRTSFPKSRRPGCTEAVTGDPVPTLVNGWRLYATGLHCVQSVPLSPQTDGPQAHDPSDRFRRDPVTILML